MIKAILKFVRPKIIITCSYILLLGSFVAGGLSLKTLMALLVIIVWYIHASSSNDYADRHIDAINLRGDSARPLQKKTVTHRDLWRIHSAAGLLSIALSLVFGLAAVALTLVILLFDYAYSFKPFIISYRGVLAQFMLPLAYVILPFSLGYWSINTSEPYPYVLVAALYLGFSARLFLKDFRDVKGDKKYGKHTFLVRHGRRATCIAGGMTATVSFVIMCFAIKFSIGALTILAISHVIILALLTRLAGTGGKSNQLKLVRLTAKIANGSVLAVLTLFVVQTYFGMDSPWTIWLPLAVGTLWLMNTYRSMYGVQT